MAYDGQADRSCLVGVLEGQKFRSSGFKFRGQGTITIVRNRYSDLPCRRIIRHAANVAFRFFDQEHIGAGLMEGDVPKSRLVRICTARRAFVGDLQICRQLNDAAVNRILGSLVLAFHRKGERVAAQPFTAGQFLGHHQVRSSIQFTFSRIGVGKYNRAGITTLAARKGAGSSQYRCAARAIFRDSYSKRINGIVTGHTISTLGSFLESVSVGTGLGIGKAARTECPSTAVRYIRGDNQIIFQFVAILALARNGVAIGIGYCRLRQLIIGHSMTARIASFQSCLESKAIAGLEITAIELLCDRSSVGNFCCTVGIGKVQCIHIDRVARGRSRFCFYRERTCCLIFCYRKGHNILGRIITHTGYNAGAARPDMRSILADIVLILTFLGKLDLTEIIGCPITGTARIEYHCNGLRTIAGLNRNMLYAIFCFGQRLTCVERLHDERKFAILHRIGAHRIIQGLSATQQGVAAAVSDRRRSIAIDKAHILRRNRCIQLAILQFRVRIHIRNVYRDRSGVMIIGNAVQGIRITLRTCRQGFFYFESIGADLAEGDIAKAESFRHTIRQPRNTGGGGAHRQTGIIFGGLRKREIKLFSGERITPVQRLGAAELCTLNGNRTIHCIGVGEGHRSIRADSSRQRTLAIIGNIHGDGSLMAIIGDTVFHVANSIFGSHLSHLEFVFTGFLEGDVAECTGYGLAILCRCVANFQSGRRHLDGITHSGNRSFICAFQFKGEFIAGLPVAATQDLGNCQIRGAIQRVRRSAVSVGKRSRLRIAARNRTFDGILFGAESIGQIFFRHGILCTRRQALNRHRLTRRQRQRVTVGNGSLFVSRIGIAARESIVRSILQGNGKGKLCTRRSRQATCSLNSLGNGQTAGRLGCRDHTVVAQMNAGNLFIFCIRLPGGVKGYTGGSSLIITLICTVIFCTAGTVLTGRDVVTFAIFCQVTVVHSNVRSLDRYG